MKSLFRFFSPNQSDLTRAGLMVRMVLVFMAVNLLGLWVAKAWFYDRPLFNLDYVLVALVYLWISRTAAAVLLVMLFFTECARYLVPTYFFTKQALSILFWVRAASNWSPVVLLGIMAMLCGLVLVMTLLFRRYRVPLRLRVEATLWTLGTVFLLMLGDSLNGTNSLYSIHKGGNLYEINFAGSPLNVVLRKTWETIEGKPAVFTPIPPANAATGRYFQETLSGTNTPADLSHGIPSLLTDEHRERLPDKLVVVIFESLSVLTADQSLNDWRRPFEPLKNRYALESGTLDWFGATFRGEVRELCWQSLDGHEIQSFPPTLPATLKKLGYETDAFHGFYKTTYDRDRFYPELGFEKCVFLDEMRRTGNVPLAGTLFHGAQDTYVASLVHEEVLRPGKKLVYWMTLSSHFPMNAPFAREIATPDELASAGDLPISVWAYRVICRRTLESIAAMAEDKALDNCDFVIVGDHPVPITSAEMRSYIEPNKIPYLILRHKEPSVLTAD